MSASPQLPHDPRRQMPPGLRPASQRIPEPSFVDSLRHSHDRPRCRSSVGAGLGAAGRLVIFSKGFIRPLRALESQTRFAARVLYERRKSAERPRAAPAGLSRSACSAGTSARHPLEPSGQPDFRTRNGSPQSRCLAVPGGVRAPRPNPLDEIENHIQFHFRAQTSCRGCLLSTRRSTRAQSRAHGGAGRGSSDPGGFPFGHFSGGGAVRRVSRKICRRRRSGRRARGGAARR